MLHSRPLGMFEVSAVSLGCMNLSHAYSGFPPEADSIRLLNHALDAGVTMLDTAALYGSGANEALIGKAVGHRRSEFILASKCVLGMFNGQRGLDGRPEAITQTLDEALLRLGTDHIDLYYLHRLDPAVPIEDSMGAMVSALKAGKIRAIGLSEVSAEIVRRAHAVHPIAAVQTEYSTTSRNAELAILDVCDELGIAFVAFSPLGRGLLAGAITGTDYPEGDLRLSFPRFREPNISHNLMLFERFATLSAQAGLAPAQLAIGWLLEQRSFVIALPGTRSMKHLDENLTATSVMLAPDLVAAVDAIFPPGAVAGARYPRAMQAQVGTETFPGETLG